jgi:hypothetical protein
VQFTYNYAAQTLPGTEEVTPTFVESPTFAESPTFVESPTTGSPKPSGTTGKTNGNGSSGKTSIPQSSDVITTGFVFPDRKKEGNSLYNGNSWITVGLSLGVGLCVCSCIGAVWAMKYKKQANRTQKKPEDLKQVVVTSPAAPPAPSSATTSANKSDPALNDMTPTPASVVPPSPDSVSPPSPPQMTPESPQHRISMDLPSLRKGKQKIREGKLSDDENANSQSSSPVSSGSSNGGTSSEEEPIEKGFEIVEIKPSDLQQEFEHERDVQSRPAFRV